MNTKNNNFQFSRLLMVMRWDMFTNLKSYLNMMLGMTFALLPFFIMQLYQLSKQYQLFPDTIDLSYWGMSQYVLMIFSIAMYMMATQIFMVMKTTGQREQFLMLPASNLEKYISRFLFSTLGAAVAMITAIVVSDLVQLIFSFVLLPGHHQSVCLSIMALLWKIWTTFIESIDSAGALMLSLLIMTCGVLVHSFFILCGTLFRKHTIVVSGILFIVMIYLVIYVIESVPGTITTCLMHGDNSWIFCLLIAELLLAGFQYWLSYKVFTRMQVICNRWINL
ncbi:MULTISPECIES: hypothetical protein [unclassified Prevotella]|uniref:hypothetical protein n=1 Tax=unclassified Prevotella TaxID=2638335 RepID=UPI001180E095|nr:MULTISPECIES: hypothetical protein [unclassified Prevotella]MBS7318622.1 hypothetical protein [Prevotella sp.]MCI7001532.1 hypothetical protein [Prevotella sp.]